MDEIPRCFEGHDRFRKYGITHKMRDLEVGEYVIFPLNKRTSIHQAGNRLGFKIVTRQMGSPDTVRCYRVE